MECFYSTNDEVYHTDTDCNHQSVNKTIDGIYCNDCFTQITEITHEKSWTYSKTDQGVSLSRYHVQENYKKGTMGDIEKIYGKSIAEAAQIYFDNFSETAKDSNQKKFIVRGKKRSALKGVCVFYALRDNGIVNPWKDISEKMGIKMNDITNMDSIFLKFFPYKKQANNPYLLTKSILEKIHLNKKTYNQDIEKIYKTFNTKLICILNKSKPTSIAAGIVYMYTETNGLLKYYNITKQDFLEKVSLCETTLNGMSIMISNIIPTEYIKTIFNGV